MLEKLELHREGKKELEMLLKGARAPLDEKLAASRAAKEKEEKEKEEGRKQGVEQFFRQVDSLFAKIETTPPSEVEASFQELLGQKLSFNRDEKEKLSSLQESFSGRLLERELAVAQSEDELVAVYEKLQGKQGQLREEIQAVRKALGGSNLDITASFSLRRQSEEKKAELEKIERLLKKIEAKIG